MKPNRPKRLLIFATLTFCTCAISTTIAEYTSIADADLHPMILSDRVGESIDSLERSQFCLFPKEVIYGSSIIYQFGKDDHDYKSGYVVEITAADGKRYRSINRDPGGIMLLRDYLDNYEANKEELAKLMKNRKTVRSIRDTVPVYEKVNDPFKVKWHIVDYDDALGLPITGEEIRLFNTKKTNTRVDATGCCAASCCIAGVAWGAAFNTASWGGEDITGTVLLISIPGVLIGAGAGYTMGTVVDKRETIRAIKRGRWLRPVQ